MPGDHQPAQTGRTEEAAHPRSSQRNVQTVVVKRIQVETGDEQVSEQIKKAVELRMQMDLRDYFAAKAMQGLIIGTHMWSHDEDDSGIAQSAYHIADVMLKEREK